MVMNRTLSTSIGGSLVLALLAGCGGSMSPTEQLVAAEKASAAGDHEAALTLYDGVVKWSGKGEVSKGEKFKASLGSVKEKVALGQLDVAETEFKALYENYDEMKEPTSYRKLLAVLQALDESPAEPDIKMASLGNYLELANSKHPAEKEKFQGFVSVMVEKLESAGKMGAEAKARLASLGYLGG